MDGLEFYLPMQESSGIDTAASETMNSYDMAMYNGVTIGSDIINGHTIYKRIFGTGDYGWSSYQPNWSSNSYTILIQVKVGTSSGDHTVLNFGRNCLSIGADNTSLQLEVGGALAWWNGATPFSSIMNIFVTIDLPAGRTTLYTCTSSTRTERCFLNGTPGTAAAYTRLARGTSGDANHQDYEYLDNGEVRSIAIWNRVLTEQEMKDICAKLDNDGERLVE